MRQQGPAAGPADEPLKVLIVCDHASAQYGGEAILPLHYFRVLRNSGHDVFLVGHARSRAELTALFPDEHRIHYVEDHWLHRAIWKVGGWLPTGVAMLTTAFVLRVVVQRAQVCLVRRLVAAQGIDVVHQPTPVSPREPSLMYRLGAPVVIGPMNGGMDYPPSFRGERGRLETLLLRSGRRVAPLLNALMPGKRHAALLLVANPRARAALPANVCPRIEELVENGVDLDMWTPRRSVPRVDGSQVPTFAFVGRLISLKAVDLLLESFARAAAEQPMRLLIIGDGAERERLELQAAGLFARHAAPPVSFVGWLPQDACAVELEQVDCLLMPSLHDCGGAVVLEAMAMGKPVIATAWGGPLDYLDPSCGILIEPRDRQGLVDGFAAAILRLARSPAERANLGRAARHKIEAQFDWDMKARQIVAVYRQVLRAPARWTETACTP